MSVVKSVAIAAALLVGASSLAMAQYNSGPAGGGVGTESGKSGSAQNNDRGPGKNTGTGAMTGQDRK